jgi:hypothetical protein
VLDFYKAHASEYPRPEQVVITMLTVQEPALDAAQVGNSGALQAWEARMKERADSLLAALRRGAASKSRAAIRRAEDRRRRESRQDAFGLARELEDAAVLVHHLAWESAQ